MADEKELASAVNNLAKALGPIKELATTLGQTNARLRDLVEELKQPLPLKE